MARKDNLLSSFGISNEDNKPQETSFQSEEKKATKKENNSRQTTIMFYGESHLYAKLRAKELKRKGIGNGNISDFIEWLICKDKVENKETYLLSEKYYLMEKELNQSSNNIT